MAEKIAYANKFDFDIGSIIKSPCRNCGHRSDLPDCSKRCNRLEQIQKILAGGISCSNSFSELEAYPLSRQDI